MIELDGSYLEGGGSILRLATAFSAVTSKPVRITNIRAGRKNPGLQPQHLTGVKAVASLCDAKTEGAELHSTRLEFWPGKILGGNLEFDIGTAGAISLVLQSLMIPALHSQKPLDIIIKGGTFVRWSPSMGYLQNVTLEILKSFGYKGEISVKKHGFYPTGGGLVKAKLERSNLKPINLVDRGKLKVIKVHSTISSSLKDKKIEKRVDVDAQKFGGGPIKFDSEYVDSSNPGGGIDAYAKFDKTVIGSNSIFERGKRTEDVAKEVFSKLKAEIDSGAVVDEYLSDQLIPYLALFGGEVRTSKVSKHTKTNIWVVEKFLPVKFEIKGDLIKLSKK